MMPREGLANRQGRFETLMRRRVARCAMSRCVVPASCVGAGNYGLPVPRHYRTQGQRTRLRASEAQQRSVLSALSEAVLVFDPEGGWSA